MDRDPSSSDSCSFCYWYFALPSPPVPGVACSRLLLVAYAASHRYRIGSDLCQGCVPVWTQFCVHYTCMHWVSLVPTTEFERSSRHLSWPTVSVSLESDLCQPDDWDTPPSSHSRSSGADILTRSLNSLEILALASHNSGKLMYTNSITILSSLTIVIYLLSYQ